MGLFVALCVMSVSFTSCKNGSDENNMINNEWLPDDTKSLDDLTAYDFNELSSFFEGYNANECIGFGTCGKTLKFSEVNKRYPIQILRTKGYSVYKVIQGGYFYVFWVTPFSTSTGEPNEEASVYFTAYLPINTSPDLFDCITTGVSTARDVKAIDPYFELCFLMSSGIFSYSYIDEDTILEIEYAYDDSINEYDDLVVKEKKIVSRDSVSSRYSSILPSDIP